MSEVVRRRQGNDDESSLVLLGKSLLFVASAVLYLFPYSTASGLWAAVIGIFFSLFISRAALSWRLRWLVVALASASIFTLALISGWWIGESRFSSSRLGIMTTLKIVEIVELGGITFSFLLLLHFSALRWPLFSLAEVLTIAGASAVVFSDHRHRMISRPRAFSDWAWSHGIDPSIALVAVGIVSTIIALFLFLRGQRLSRLLGTLLVLLLVGSSYFMWRSDRWDSGNKTDPLGLTGKQRDSAGGGQGSQQNQNQDRDQDKNPFKDDYSNPKPPVPVAIAVFHDDYSPPGSVLYFRQQALSLFNGHHLVSASATGFDEDVLKTYPREGELKVPSLQNVPDHRLVPTTMYLLAEHSQPLALSHGYKIKFAHNPNPRQFVAAYDVWSQTLVVPPARLLGRNSIARDWPAAQKQHYLALPNDPRYRALAELIVREEIDPRFAHDDLARAIAIKRWLEREGFYTLRSTHSGNTDPTASFLFGSLRGYCVHFAHATVYLLRSLGIAARVALGYAVMTNKRGGGSSVLIMGDRAHAWPEIYLEGVGWVTLDVYPQNTDMPPPAPVDYDLEKLLGEMARGDETAGVVPEGKALVIPWRPVLRYSLALVGALLLFAYLIKWGRAISCWLSWSRWGPKYFRRRYRALLDQLAALGYWRGYGETREKHAARLQQVCPHFMELTWLHLGLALGSAKIIETAQFNQLVKQVKLELRQNLPWYRRVGGWLNPLGWIWSR